MFFISLPVFFYATGDFPRRTVLKEAISLLTLIGLSLMLAQFFLTRSGNSLLPRYNMVKVITMHKIIGYALLSIFLVHPLLLVLPRYFEAGLEPADCLVTILRSYTHYGVLSGIFAWCLVFILLGTALFRKKMPLAYKTWVAVHKWLSITLIIFACWHAIDLGRHTNGLLSTYIVFLALCGIFLLLKDFISPIILHSGISK